MFPFYEEKHDRDVQEKIKANVTAFIDPRYKDRSFAEAKLVDLIRLCWVSDPDQRIDIFQLAKLLRTAVKMNSEQEAQKLRLLHGGKSRLLLRHEQD